MAKNSATQDFVPIKDVKNGIVILKSGQMCTVLLASSINFALKSSDEQQAILAQFQSFLNTLDFSIQFFVRSRRLDISPYIELLREREPEQDNDLMRIQLREYIEFIQTFTSEVDIMTKSFFVVIPYSPIPKSVKGGIQSLLKRKDSAEIDPMQFEEHMSQLEQRVAVVEQGLRRIGIRTIPLGNDELIELFYHLYNPNEESSAPQQS